MSLLDELQGLDISGIVEARVSLRASIQAPGLQAVVEAGAAPSALGDLGRQVQAIQAAFPDPQALLRPVVEAVARLGEHFDAQDLPILEYTTAVREGAEIAGRILALAASSPPDFSLILGTSLDQAFQFVQAKAGEAGSSFGAGADAFAQMVRLVESHADVRDPRAVGELAIEVLLPFPKADLTSLFERVEELLLATAGITLPTDRATGLLAALEAVSDAAIRADAAALDLATRRLREARARTLATLQDDLRFAVEQINRLRLSGRLDLLMRLSGSLQIGRRGALEFLGQFRAMLRDVNVHLDRLDFEQIRVLMRELPATIEATAREVIEVPVDRAVARAKEVVRGLLRHLPLHELREELTSFLRNAAQAIAEANLDAPARAVRGALASVREKLDSGGLAADIQGALAELEGSVSAALDGVIGPLEAIATEIDSLAEQAEGVLDRLATGLVQFQAAIEGVSVALDGLGIVQAEDQIVRSLQKLRETAEALLSAAPLPEPLRPQVEQLIALLEGIDFNTLMEPARTVAAELRVPSDVAGTVEAGLARARDVVENLIPAQLVASIEAEVGAALDVVRKLNPASLLPDVSGYLNQAAESIERLDPRPIAETIRPPFQTVLEAIDRVHPRLLLAPVIDAYDAMLGKIPTPSPEATSTSLLQAFDSAGRVVGRTVLEPVRRIDPNSQTEIGDPAQRAPTPDAPPNRDQVRAGDAIRLVGYLPSKLRELLAALGEGPAGEALRQIDGLCSGLARKLRAVQTALIGIQRRLDTSFEDLLGTIGPAQLQAQFALRAGFSGRVGFEATLEAVAEAGPAAMRAELRASLESARSMARAAASQGGGAVGGALDRAATALESSPLATLAGDLDGLLAALDPEPIALEMDAIVDRVLTLTPRLLQELLPEANRLVERLRALIDLYEPGAQARKFLGVLDVLREELDILDPARLADELAEIHAAIRDVVAAYDPRLLALELYEAIRAIAAQLRGLDPQVLLGDVSFLQAAVDRVAQANPAIRLADVGASLRTVGERLDTIDLEALIEAVNSLGPQLVESFGHALDAIRKEIVALLESLRYASGGASVSVSVSARVGSP